MGGVEVALEIVAGSTAFEPAEAEAIKPTSAATDKVSVEVVRRHRHPWPLPGIVAGSGPRMDGIDTCSVTRLLWRPT
ncbi:MAG: hypothetical protein AB7V46_00035 [Thermomicrobiales bacterium]